ncbi:MAG: hypothetical protein PUE38_06550 [Olsenella sp.]|nr:hypothetical protein [Olsenella sp.]
MSTFDAIPVPDESSGAASFGFAPCEGGVCAASGVAASGVHAGFR